MWSKILFKQTCNADFFVFEIVTKHWYCRIHIVKKLNLTADFAYFNGAYLFLYLFVILYVYLILQYIDNDNEKSIDENEDYVNL